MMDIFHVGCASEVVVPPKSLKSLSVRCIPEMRPPCRDSPAALMVWPGFGNLEGECNKDESSHCLKRKEELGAFKNRPSLFLERTADSCAIHMGFESHRKENGPSRDTCQRLQGR